MAVTVYNVAQICTMTGVDRKTLATLVSAMAHDRKLYESVMRRVHLEHATGRPANDAGDDVVDPGPLAVRMVKDFQGAKAGQTVTKPYAEALDLLNAHVAELIR